MKAMPWLTALAALVFVAGCSTSSAQYVPQPNLRVKLPGQDLCRIYIFRADQAYGSGKQLWVADGTGLVIGELGTSEYLVWERPGGLTQIRLLQEAGASPRGERGGSNSFDLKAGRIYYLSVDMPMPNRRPRARIVEYGQVANYFLSSLKPAPVTGPPTQN